MKTIVIKTVGSNIHQFFNNGSFSLFNRAICTLLFTTVTVESIGPNGSTFSLKSNGSSIITLFLSIAFSPISGLIVYSVKIEHKNKP